MKDDYQTGNQVAREGAPNSFLSEKATTFLASDNLFSNAIMVVVLVAIIALYSGYNRPIWIDEFLHFAFAAVPSTSDAVAAIHRSIGSVNFGQTGVYMLLDYWLLHLFGASAILLRSPSLFASALLAFGVIALFRNRGFNILWQLAAILLVFSDRDVNSYIGEARPYMPLAGSIVGLLGYYTTAAENRTRAIAALGWCSLVFGSVMHPYFAPYYAAVLVVTYLDAMHWRISRVSIRSFILHAGVPVFLTAILLYTCVAAATWLTQDPALALDPFQWVKRDDVFWFVIATHFQFLPGSLLFKLMIVSCGVLTAPIVFIFISRQDGRQMLAPALLMTFALAITALLITLSFHNHYWILPRQWIASIAICDVASVWYLASIAKLLDRRAYPLALAIGAITLSLAAYRCWQAADFRLGEVAQWSIEQQQISATALPEEISVLSTNWRDVLKTNDDWVRLANQNIAKGGPVWPIFTKYYEPD